MPQSVKVGYTQNYDSDTETGLAGVAEATGVAVNDAEGRLLSLRLLCKVS